MAEFCNIKLPMSKWDKVVCLYEQGNKISQIARTFNVSPGTIRNCLTKMKVVMRPDNTPHNWKGGRHKTRSGYIMLYSPNHPRTNKRGYVLEHIWVWEMVTRRPLPKDYLIHHLNGVKDDNRFENLLATTKQNHHRLSEPYRKRIRELEGKIRKLEKKHEVVEPARSYTDSTSRHIMPQTQEDAG